MSFTNEPSLTEAIQSYHGIFKGLHDSKLKEKFIQTRKLFFGGKIQEGKALLEEAIAVSDCQTSDKDTLKLIYSEIERYTKYNISSTCEVAKEIDWNGVAKRQIERLNEKLWELPQSVFFLTCSIGQTQHRLCGRKLLSNLWMQNKIPEIHCSFITAGMILGTFDDIRLTETSVAVFYHPLSKEEKLKVMADIASHNIQNVELVYPFPLLTKIDRREMNSPSEGWTVDDAFDVMLGTGEERIRDYTIRFINTLNSKRSVLYDPACSTGVFLSTLKNAHPDTFTIGQDLSKQMVEMAKGRIDDVHWGNAMEPKILPGSADIVFVRFLNSEVVTSKEAERLFAALLPTVKVGGYMIIFGHTPVLLSRAYFSMIDNLAVKQCIGISGDETGIFQYYVLKIIS